MYFSRYRAARTYLLNAIGFIALSSCGGGGGGQSASTSAVPAVSGAAIPSPTPGFALAATTVVVDGASMGAVNPNWGDGSTAAGGQGQVVEGVTCNAPGANYSYALLGIYLNGQLQSLPKDIGVVAPKATSQRECVYPANTRDASGKIRIDTSAVMTLGQFFAIWGRPLSRTNVAGLTDQPIQVYINDNGNLEEYTGDLASLQLLPQREITIEVGSSLAQIPTYTWKNPPALSASPITLWQGKPIGATAWPDGDTASGGHGQTTPDGIACEPDMSDNYHVHVHVAIIKDSQMQAIPQNIGLPNGCFYEMHTHDATGVVHIEAPAYQRFTLGNLFSVWGQPLSPSNVAGITGRPVAAFINDGGEVWQYQGDLADIEMVSHRSITLQLGSTMDTIPSYSWGASAQ